ncbi:MAG TPA: putative Ig domain-containing protein [Pyrinomonadaceae bacterium]
MLEFVLTTPALRADDTTPGVYKWVGANRSGGDGDVKVGNNWDPDDTGPPGGSVPGRKDSVLVSPVNDSFGTHITLSGNLDVGSASIGGATMMGTVTVVGGLGAGTDSHGGGDTIFEKSVTANRIGGGGATFHDAVTASGATNTGLQFDVGSGSNNFVPGSSLMVDHALGIGTSGDGLHFPAALNFSGGATGIVHQAGQIIPTFNVPSTTAAFVEDGSTFDLSGSGTQFTVDGDLLVGLRFSLPFNLGANAAVNVTDGAKLITTGQTIVGPWFANTQETVNGGGDMTIDGVSSQWLAQGEVIVGGPRRAAGDPGSTGTVTISNGGTLDASGRNIILGQENGSKGTLTLDGGTSTFSGASLEIGRHGDGTLEVQNGASTGLNTTVLGVQSDGSGTILVNGKGTNGGPASMVKISGPLTIGGASTGTLKVTNGGQMINDQGPAIVGRDQKISGDVTLMGQDSQWTINGTGNVIVGQDGIGSVDISDQASFSPDSLVLGQNTNGSGGVTLTGSGGANDAKLDVSKALTVGDGGRADLTVRNGAKFTTLGQVIVGKQANSRPKSTITLEGTASTFQVNGSSDFVVGQGGMGDFAISDHATFTAPSVVLGQNANSNGNLSVTGSGGTNDAIVTVTKSLTVGDNGTGEVSVTNGGKLATEFMHLGAKGNIAVDGAMSNLTIGGGGFFDSGIDVPSTSKSRFAITGGGVITETTGLGSIFAFVDTPGGPPALVVRGSGSQFVANSGFIDIGLAVGPGTADISSGGTVSASQFDISNKGKTTVGGDATLVSTISVNDQLEVDSGGTLDIGAGGKVTAGTNIFIFNGSKVNVHDAGARLAGAAIRVAGTGAMLNISKNGNGFTDGELVIDEGGNATISDAGSNLRSQTIKVGDTATGNLMTQSDGHIESILSLTVAQSSTLSTAAGGSIDIGPTLLTKAASGEIRIGPGGRLTDNGFVTGNVTIQFGGSVTGSGFINGKLIDSGRVGSGNSPGRLTVQGDYTQNSDGLMSVEIGGTDPGSGYDQVQVSGTATIDGKLDVRLVNGFTPTVGQTFRIVNAGSFSGSFASIAGPSQAGISVSNDGGGVTVTITSVVAGAPVISSATTVAATQGQAFSYQITATNNPTSFGAMNLPDGLTVDHARGLISGTPTKAGNYVAPMAANNSAGSGQADLIIDVGPPPVTKPPQLLNISTRMRVLTGNNVLIGGFIVTGTEPKNVIIRGIGPSLGALGLSGVLADPTLELHQPDGTVVTNDNWKINAQTGQSQEADIRATTIPPTDDLESAIVATLPPGNYSAVLAGKNQTSGIGVVEVYDLGQAANSQLANISSRGFIDTGDNVMIGGFIVGGGTGGSNAKVIVRALGPSVPVAGALGDPTLEVHDASGTIVASNDNWKTRPDGSSQQAEIEATTIPPTNDLDSALVASLPPGNYTAVVRGINNTTGVGLVEVYNLQ